MDINSVDVVIIGAGASGLAAAYKLISVHSIRSVVVLEANERVGGRVFAVDLPTANGRDKWDMGGQWVGSPQHVIMQLLKEFDIEVYPQYTTGRSKLIVNSLEDIRTYSGLIPNLGVLELLDMHNIVKKVSAMVEQIPLDDPLKCKNAKVWDQETVYSFLKKSCYFEASQNMFNIVAKTLFGCETSQMSLFYMLYSCGLCGGFESLLETSEGSAQEYRVKGTIYSLILKLEEAIGKEKVICGDPVVFVKQENSSDSHVLVKTERGRVYRAKHVISAIPPHLIDRIQFEPPLPYYRQQLGQRMPMGNIIKCLAVYISPFWREMNFSGESLMLCRPFDIGPFIATFDVTTSNGSPALVGFIAGEQAIYWSQKTKEERKKATLTFFVALFGNKARTELVTYEDKDWSKEKYIGGCPAGLMQPGCLVYFEHVLRKPFERVHWAGTETARRWMGYVDGAAEAGQRAADEVAACIGSNQIAAETSVDSPSPIFAQKSVKSDKRFRNFFLFGVVACCGSYFVYKLYHGT